MASRTRSTPMKPSFASIVARAPPAKKGHNAPENDGPNLAQKPTSAPAEQLKEIAENSSLPENDSLQASMVHLEIKETLQPAPIEVARQAGVLTRAGLKFEEDRTHDSTSSTKGTSVDGKSAISGITFGLDEKESLRPDDSASVKAAEEDDFGSGPASGAPSSRLGSEAGVKAFRDQFQEISRNMRRGHAETLRPVDNVRRNGAGSTESHRLSVQPVIDGARQSPVRQLNSDSEVPAFAYEYKGPDEKLLEALQSSKDRTFLLKLEDQVIDFVTHSHDPILDLPPCNSFCRLLAHKLADYYALTHFVDNAVSAVRLYRTPYCRTPVPLSTIVKQIVPDKLDQSAQQNFKIMRRKNLSEGSQHMEPGETTAPTSAEPSKAASEVGGDSQNGTGMVSPTESNVTKDKATMTREEREAKYKETRERIFKGFESAESADSPVTTEPVNGNCRTGSHTGRKKSWKNRNNDGSFEVRSQYVPGYNNQQYRPVPQDQQPPDANAFFNSYQYQQQYHYDPNHPTELTHAAYQHGFARALQAMSEPGFAMGFQHAQMVNNMAANGQAIGQQLPGSYGPNMSNAQFQQFYPQMSLSGHQSPVASSPAMSHPTHIPRSQSQPSNQPWLQTYPSFAYPQNQHHFQMGYTPEQAPTENASYQHSLMNFAHGSPDMRFQQQPPDSFPQQVFNPQTTPFVPGNAGSPFSLMQPQTQVEDGSQYHSMKSGYSNQLYGVPQSSSQVDNVTMPQFFQANGSNDQRGSHPHRGGSGDLRHDTNSVHSISKWNTPASLPPKPPPPESPDGIPTPSPRATLPYNTRMNGQQVPTFQNGLYTLPAASSR